ncbi:SOS response-associated peptidase [Motilibacter aurantiacus]|uniref:SOS response-associated peptidase n=1 Tax=Motilibacter aurantiacus TaxID=2714955 RepID=UPI00140958C4|nr:SOS response-associated peptidase [Motilibacter aurantiacus]
MCGRYAASRRPEDLVEEFEADVDADAGAEAAAVPPSWNVAPTDPVRVVLERAVAQGGSERQLRTVRWGLVPSWSRDPSGAARMINARLETVAEKPAFRAAFRARRCLVPADGYYEWHTRDDGAKQPFFIRRRDGRPLAMAGLYEMWRAPGEGSPWLWTATIITTSAVDELGRLHDRMPMLVERDRWHEWLDPALDAAEQVRGLLGPAGPGVLEAYPVSPAVGNVRNNGPHLVEPAPVAEEVDGAAPTLF